MKLVRFVTSIGMAVIATSAAAMAHPLGNFTSNHLTRITVESRRVDLRFVQDLAEIPTFAILRSLDGDGRPPASRLDAWARNDATAVAPQLHLAVDGVEAPLITDGSSIRLRPGAGGLSTLYAVYRYHIDAPNGVHRIAYHDATMPGRLGWKDVVVAPATEPTNELRTYPNALIGSPRQRVSLAMSIDAAGVVQIAPDAAADTAAPSAARMDDLSAMLTRDLSNPLILIGALLIAVGLGALHALEPGHGKTLLAVSLVGARATPRQAVILAVALTAAHTTGVLAIGAVCLFLTKYIVPEAIYPWIMLVSGAIVAVLGGRAVAAEIRKRRPIAHVHAHHHPHAHPHAHDHAHGLGVDDHAHDALDDEEHARAHAIPGTSPLSFRSALVAAASGNIAPCPAALVVLLAAITTHKDSDSASRSS